MRSLRSRRVSLFLLFLLTTAFVSVLLYERSVMKSGWRPSSSERVTLAQDGLDAQVVPGLPQSPVMCLWTVADGSFDIARTLPSWADVPRARILVFSKQHSVIYENPPLQRIMEARSNVQSSVIHGSMTFSSLLEVASSLCHAPFYGYFEPDVMAGDGLLSSLLATHAAVSDGNIGGSQAVLMISRRRLPVSPNCMAGDGPLPPPECGERTALVPPLCGPGMAAFDVLLLVSGTLPPPSEPTAASTACTRQYLNLPLTQTIQDPPFVLVDASLSSLITAASPRGAESLATLASLPVPNPATTWATIPAAWLPKPARTAGPVTIVPPSQLDSLVTARWRDLSIEMHGMVDVGIPLEVVASELPPAGSASPSFLVLPVDSTSPSFSSSPSLFPVSVPGEGDGGHQHSHGLGVSEPIGDPMVTVFITMSPSQQGSQKFYIHQNTLAALTKTPGVEGVVFSDSKEMAELGKRMGVEVVTDVDTNTYGTPFLKSMYKHVEHHARSKFVGYSNSDILYCSELVHTLRAVLAAVEAGTLSRRVLVVGKRYNFNMPATLDDASPYVIKDDADAVVHLMLPHAVPFQNDAQDFFFILPGTFNWDKIPDFVIGRPAYDNWLVDHAFHDNIDTVDVTLTMHAIHQSGLDGNKAGHTPRPDKDWNVKRGRNQYDHGSMSDCKFETQEQGGNIIIVKRPPPKPKRGSRW